MNWTLLAGPIIGAIIGYCTNYIAVKMLFRPWEAKYLFGRRLPFTPGIIPKSRDRIATSIGAAVGENLLTEDALEKNLLSKDLTSKISKKINTTFEKEKQDQRVVRDVITYYMDGDEFDSLMKRGELKVADVLTLKIIETDLGEIVAAQALKAIHEKQEKSFWAKFITEDFIHSLLKNVSNRVNRVVAQEGPTIIQNKIQAEFDDLQEKTVGEVFTMLEETGIDFGQVTVSVYETLIRKKLPSMLRTLDIAGIVREKMDTFTPKEMEELTFKIAKKELNAIVNLGALIGFVLGMANVLVNLI